MIFHGGAVQGYRGVVALLPERDLGIALMWNSDSSLPTGLLPTMLDRAIGLNDRAWLDIEFDDPSLFANGSHTGHAESESERRRHDDHQSHGLAEVIIWQVQRIRQSSLIR